MHELRLDTSSSTEGQSLKSHELIADKLKDVLNVHNVNIENENVQLEDHGGKKPSNHTSHT